MASILDKYGIKEVADVTFYKLENGQPTVPVLYLDTLKVSTIEQTAENVEAKGGKGNVALVSWDYGKEINVTLEDALFSAKSMALMFGGANATIKSTASLIKTIEWEAKSTGATPSAAGMPSTFEANGRVFNVPTTTMTSVDGCFDETGASVSAFTSGARYFTRFNMPVVNSGVIEITAANFPGTYYVTGDTYARSEKDGTDEFFQFIIPKAKVAAENTITLEAEGDPSTFNMSLRVLRPADGVMMKLVKYDMTEAT